MSWPRRRRGWERPEATATPESIFHQRRRIIAQLGLGAGALLAGGALLPGCFDSISGVADDGGVGGRDGHPDAGVGWTKRHADLYPAPPNARYVVPERATTPEDKATSYNNYYEFTTNKSGVVDLAPRLTVEPWTVEIAGLVPKPGPVDFDALVRQFTLEERLYRFRCVEAWAMTVPWTGFPLAKLIDWVQPLSSARYVRFVTLQRASEMPGIGSSPWYPWPYHEGLRMDEARNELAMMVTGVYGRPLPNQNGAPLRLIVPWKYGYKSIKAIVRIEFVAEQPETFWSTLVPAEYPFLSNIDPEVPHPRWSQAQERLIDTGETVPTQKYNGYGEFVASLYS